VFYSLTVNAREGSERMKIPPRQYERPTIREILTFATDPFTEERATAFICSFGYLRRLPVVRRSRTFSTAQLQPGGLPEEMPGSPWSEPTPTWSGDDEGMDLWRSEWRDMNTFAELYASIMQHPSERTVLPVGVIMPQGEYRGDVILAFDETEPLYIIDEAAENAGLRKAAARLVALKLDETTPLSGYSLVNGVLARWTAGTLLYHIWTVFLRLASGADEAKRCSVCQRWEVKGSGYTRSNWTVHERCGANERNKAYQKREREKDRLALEAVRQANTL
jgi:hypothetical protein